MRDVQPPITNDQELAGYRSGLERFNEIVAAREAAVFASRDDMACQRAHISSTAARHRSPALLGIARAAQPAQAGALTHAYRPGDPATVERRSPAERPWMCPAVRVSIAVGRRGAATPDA